ncbi:MULTISPECIES: hypothetical protein [Bacteroidales]|jgi:hypothetical protein|uniref:hypothetical protein n=1 Tax=Bacteroidales TaxID=171549 RepID=UPI0015528DB9|nr:hypothetical protein [Xylanibacter rodentium]NPE37541.1 hypothetical protein [Prevotella sp. PCJ2]
MERLDFNNIGLELCPEYYDLKRVAESMYDDKDLFVYVMKSQEEEMTFIGALASVFVGGVYGMAPTYDVTVKVAELVTNMRKVFKKKDTESLNKVWMEFMQRPKEDVVTVFIESLSKMSTDKQAELIGHLMGNRPESEDRVAVEIIKRDNEHKKNRDQYDYYVCFKNIRTNVVREVKFKNHASAAIYVMFLIDRLIRKNESAPIDVLKNTDTLQDIYNKMFASDCKLKGLKLNLVTDSEGNYRTEKQRLSQYYTDINNAVSDKIHEWDFVLPYRCDSTSSIRLNPDLITIPKELIPENWVIHE